MAFCRLRLVYKYMSRVIVIRHKRIQPDKAVASTAFYRQMILAGLEALFFPNSPSVELKKALPGRSVAMKTNCLTRNLNSTPAMLIEALISILKDAGWDENDIIVWDRSNRELEGAGFKLNASSFGCRVMGTDTSGVGYSEEFYSFGEANSLVSRILTEMVGSNINIPVLKDHSIAGISGCLKNMFGAINNPNKYHGNNCDPYAADISCLEPLRTKNRLAVIDAVKVQYQGGPGYDSRHMGIYGGIIIASDPVAADRIGLEIVENFRRENSLPPLEKTGRPVRYLETAERNGLGTAGRDKIDLQVRLVDESGHVSAGELWP